MTDSELGRWSRTRLYLRVGLVINIGALALLFIIMPGGGRLTIAYHLQVELALCLTLVLLTIRMASPNVTSLIRRIARHAPPGQVVRYLVVGGVNTLFGYGVFALLNYLLTPFVPLAYEVAIVLGAGLCITVSFLGHKFFVFRTEGRLWAEYLRSYVVYVPSTLASLVLMPPAVMLLRLVLKEESAPYAAAAILTGGTVIATFFLHKQYTFAQKPENDAPKSP